MSKSLRLSEKWFRRGLWLVALVFAGFLIGLGSTIVGDLPRVEKQLQLDDFIDRAQADPLRASIKAAGRTERDADEVLQQAQLKLKSARADSAAARETFNNWIATRGATQQSAQTQLTAEYRKVELRVFLYRLALTLPLLAIAGWLFVKKRKGTYWPFVWGFIFFALFAFFVELVPYLPSYGGYVRYIVGIGITVLVGRYAIVALNRYLEKQKLAEAMPDMQRREELSYDVALTRLSKGVCPGCERAVDLKDKTNDFCPHCGIGLHDHCGKCQTRKSAFAKFCHACGTGAKILPVVEPLASATK
jgi:hypothetical protein